MHRTGVLTRFDLGRFVWRGSFTGILNEVSWFFTECFQTLCAAEKVGCAFVIKRAGSRPSDGHAAHRVKRLIDCGWSVFVVDPVHLLVTVFFPR